MEKNAHAQSNAVSFAVTIFPSGHVGGELRLFKKVSQSVSQSVRRRLTNLQVRGIFVSTLSSLSIVFVHCYCRYGMTVTRWSEWSNLNGLCRCIFDALRVSGFNGLHWAPGPFLLWQTTICHDGTKVESQNLLPSPSFNEWSSRNKQVKCTYACVIIQVHNTILEMPSTCSECTSVCKVF